MTLEIFKDTCATCLSHFNDEAKITPGKFFVHLRLASLIVLLSLARYACIMIIKKF